MTKVKRAQSFYVGNIELKVGENDGFVEERNYFDEEGRLISTEADRGDKVIIETIYEYDEKGRNVKITSTLHPKVKLIHSKGANPALNNSITIELSYDDQDRLVEVIRNGLVTETWKYAKTGRTTHMTYRDENYGLCEIKEVIDRNGDLVLRNVVVGGQQISKFSKVYIRGVYSITEENKAKGVYCIRKSRIRKEGNKEILISNSEIESAPGFRSAKELLEIRYNDNNDIEYMKTKETINGMVNITEKKCIYKNGKLHSIVDGNGHEEICRYTTKNKYEVVRSMPTNLMSMLNHLYEYDITKETKKATYHFVGTTKEMQFTIEHKEDLKDQFQFSTSFILAANDDNPNIDIHCVKDNMTIDLLHDENGYIVVIQYENENGKNELEVRHRSAHNTSFKQVYDFIMDGSRGKEVQKFITDVKAIAK